MKKTILLCSFLTILVASVGCRVPLGNEDPFYSAWTDWGSPRFPLIKPYDVDYIGQKEGWTIPLHVTQASNTMRHYQSIYGVQKIAVKQGAIMVYAPYERKFYDDLTDKVLYWFVIVPDNNIETGFENETDFLKFVAEYEIHDIEWESPGDLNRRFLDTGCLEWIPGCD